MSIRWTACIVAGVQVLATATLAQTTSTPSSPKVINKDAAPAAANPSASSGAPAAVVPAAPVAPAAAIVAPAAPVPVAPVAAAPVQPAPVTSAPAAATAASAAPVAPTADAGEKTIAKTVAPPPKPQPTLAIAVDLTNQRMTVSEDGVDKYRWPISSGRAGYETPTGSYRPQWMAKMWRSRKYDDAPMPNSIFFTGGFAIHATFATGMLGRPASHGCVRLAPANAQTLFKTVQSHGMDRTRITVFGAPRRNEPAVARRDDGERARHAAGLHAPAQRFVQAGYPPIRYSNAAPQYVVAQAPQQKTLFAAIFGSNEQANQVVMASGRPPRQMPARMVQQVRQPQLKPMYAYTQDGRLVRIR